MNSICNSSEAGFAQRSYGARPGGMQGWSEAQGRWSDLDSSQIFCVFHKFYDVTFVIRKNKHTKVKIKKFE